MSEDMFINLVVMHPEHSPTDDHLVVDPVLRTRLLLD